MKIPFITLLLAGLFLTANAQLTTSKLFGDHTVLQRNQAIPVWGWSAKRAKVNVRFNGQLVKGRADENGNWKVLLNPMPAGGPYIMTISCGKDKLVYSDIMLGEVWIASGQSNMELRLNAADGYHGEKKVAAQMPIRQFLVPQTLSLKPEKDVSGGQWIKADTGTIGNFTAVGYFFAKKIAQNLHVTVGLINSSWGGTEAEDWISKDAMLANAELSNVAKALPTDWSGVKNRIEKKFKEYAYRNGPVVNYTPEQLAVEPTTFFDNWQYGSAPAAWKWMGKLYSYSGEGFMQRTIKLDSGYESRNSVLRLGQTDADLNIYVNGKQVQKGALSNSYQVSLPAGIWKPGNNSLLIQLMSKQKSAAWFGMGIYGTTNDLYVRFNDTTINLADANWRVMPDLSKPYDFEFWPNNTAFMLYNTMINPLVPYAIAGTIWYQGESNAGRAYQYKTVFPLMISDWRNRWKQDFPFLFVQLPAYGGTQNSNSGSEWAELREAQNSALQLPNTAEAVTIDVGDANNLHPRNKADVGYRLAGKALTLVYRLPGYGENPWFSSADFNNNYAIVNFAHAEKGLMVKDKYDYIKGFELAGADHKFYYAQALITGDNKVKVWCSQVPHPVAVRYAWTDAPVDANLFIKDGMPVAPFRSDNWKGITDSNKYQ